MVKSAAVFVKKKIFRAARLHSQAVCRDKDCS
jgi:hypothetical protein